MNIFRNKPRLLPEKVYKKVKNGCFYDTSSYQHLFDLQNGRKKYYKSFSGQYVRVEIYRISTGEFYDIYPMSKSEVQNHVESYEKDAEIVRNIFIDHLDMDVKIVL